MQNRKGGGYMSTGTIVIIVVLVLLFGAFVLGRTWMPVAIGIIALGSFITVVQRIIYVLAQRSSAS